MNPTPPTAQSPTTFGLATVQWGDDGIPRSPLFGDVFHSIAGAQAQCEHVFIQGTELPKVWAQQADTAVGELGFGSGLNFLVTAQQWLTQAPPNARLYYVAIEKFPWSAADSIRLFRQAGLQSSLIEEWLQKKNQLQVGSNRIALAHGRIQLSLHIGDIELLLPQLRGRVDAWYCDGFNPSGNSEMWTEAVTKHLARLSRPGAKLATWCCAGHFRRALQKAGFQVEKKPGFANKREMLSAQFAGDFQPRRRLRRVQVVGAGLAGCWLAREFAERGVAVELYEREHGPARGASGMPMLMVRPYSGHRDTPIARFFWQAATYSVARIVEQGISSWVQTPVWRMFGDEPIRALAPAGWLDGLDLCAGLIDHPRIKTFWNHEIPTAAAWACRREPSFFCTATAALAVIGDSTPIRPIRGQLSLWFGQHEQLGDKPVRVGDCVAAAAPEGLYFGASQVHDCNDSHIQDTEALKYGSKLPQAPTHSDLNHMRHWAGVRRQSRDRLPLCGPAVAPDGSVDPKLVAGRAVLQDLPTQPNLWLNLAHGSRAATAAPLCAAILADAAMDLPAPALANELDALDPRRFLLRDWRRGHRRPGQPMTETASSASTLHQ